MVIRQITLKNLFSLQNRGLGVYWGRNGIDVAKRLGIGDGLLYTWVKKFKAANEPVAIDDMKSMQAELNRNHTPGIDASTLSPIFWPKRLGSSKPCNHSDVHKATERLWLQITLGPALLGTILHTIKSNHLISCEFNAHQMNDMLLVK